MTVKAVMSRRNYKLQNIRKYVNNAVYAKHHKCPKTCKNCGTIACITEETSERRCSQCYMLYRNEWCLEHHKCPVRCGNCMRIVKSHEHKCEEFTCRTCNK